MSRGWWSVGSAEVLLVEDGRERVPPRFCFANAPEEALSRVLAGMVDAEGLVPMPIGCLLIRVDGRVALVDAGAGRFAKLVGATAGGLEATLHRAGIGRDEIDVVVISHAHPDHIGGLTTGGEPAFPSAAHLITVAERRFWSDPEAVRKLPEFMSEMPSLVETTLAPLERNGLLRSVDGEAEILAGVRLVPAPGHTPGHAVVEISADGAQAVFLGDAVLHPIAFAHPEWISASDSDPGEAVRTRRALLEKAARNDALVLSSHLGRCGWVRAYGGALSFHPE